MATLHHQALAKDLGGNLYVDVPEGTPSSGTVAIFDGAGTATTVTADSCTVTGSQLSIAVSGSVVDELGENWRAAFTYVYSGTTYRLDVTFDVVKRVVRPTLTDALLLAYAPLLTGRKVGGQSDFSGPRAVAWAGLVSDLRRRGLSIHRVRDNDLVQRLHALAVEAYCYGQLAPGASATNDWQALAAAKRREYLDTLDGLVAGPGWYDVDEDLLPGDSAPGGLSFTRLVM